jgi:hypothetical protein
MRSYLRSLGKVRTSSLCPGSGALEQSHDVLVKGVRGLEIREVSTLLEHDEASARHRLRDPRGERDGDEVALAVED